MTEEPVKSEFLIMDQADSQQIQEAESAIKQALVYDVRGKKQLSYMGVKWIILKMSQKEQPLEIIDMPIIELMKHEPDNKSTWIWYSTIKVRNRKTGLTTLGASESPYLTNGVYDTFGRVKSSSKAERNAYRKQIPELEIQAMLDTVDSKDIHKLDTPSTNSNVPTQKQLSFLKNLGYSGPTPESKAIASNIIEDLTGDKKETQSSTSEVCVCNDSIPSSINPNICQNCRGKLQ